ncbi:MAG: FAA hydrolase family protein, partial [Alphaproteobacteria bacterium]
MKLVTFSCGGRERIGAVDDRDRIVDLHRAYGEYLRTVDRHPAANAHAAAVLGSDMCGFLARGEPALEAARAALGFAQRRDAGSALFTDRSSVRLLAPVPRPGALISAGKNFSDHVAEMSSRKGPAAPVAF